MGRYSPYQKVDQTPKRQIHPIWRGVGFIFMIIIPFLSYVGALVLIQENQKQGWMRIPVDLIAKNVGDPMLYVKIIVTIIIMLVLFAIFTLISFLIFSAFMPPRYGPHDVPPVQYRRRKQ
jgi:amino acid transporter